MSENLTRPTERSVDAFIESVPNPGRREDAVALRALFERVTGWPSVMWGESLIGYGTYHYRYESGREGTFFRTGFSPRKANMVVYVMPGYDDHAEILERLGPHKLGKSCLYLGRLKRVDLDVLEELVRAGLEAMRRRYPEDAR